MSETPRYATLQDYVRVLRRRWLLVALFTALGGLAAVGATLRQDRVYQGEASLAVRNGMVELGLVGGPAFTFTSPVEVSADTARLVTRDEVSERVRRALNLQLPAQDLADSVSGRVEAETNFVVILAEAGDAAFAARLANEFAQQVAAVTTREERERFREAADSLRASLRGLSRDNESVVFQETVISRLEALARFSRPVEVVRPAEVPETSVSPNPVRNSVLGVFVGLLLGGVAAFVRDALDRRMRSTQDVHEQLQLPVVGRVSHDAMGSVAFLVDSRGRAGWRASRTAVQEHAESIRVLRSNLEFLASGRPVRSVAVTSTLPEEGKSTVAASLACAAAIAGKSTLLIECDLRRPTLAERLGLAPAPGLADYLRGAASPQEILQSVTLVEPPSTNGDSPAGWSGPQRALTVITAGKPVAHPTELLGERIKDLLDAVTEAYDTVVLDCTPLLGVADVRELIPHVDAVLLCVRAVSTTGEQARAGKAALDRLPERPMGVVVTDIRARDEEEYGYYSSSSYRS